MKNSQELHHSSPYGVKIRISSDKWESVSAADLMNRIEQIVAKRRSLVQQKVGLVLDQHIQKDRQPQREKGRESLVTPWLYNRIYNMDI
jgi:hypothetical protein